LKETGKNFLNAKKQFMRAHENILIFYKKQPTYNPQMTNAPLKNIRQPQRHTAHQSNVYGVKKRASKNYDPTKRYPLSYGFYKSGRGRDRLHPSQKPIELCEYLITTYTNEGDVVLDNCAGSGTTGLACMNLKRNFILIEKEEEYINIITKRLNMPRQIKFDGYDNEGDAGNETL
jgi:site-specific DNA-methyltransferase (adenine-specific)